MRNKFIEDLVIHAANNDNIFLLVGDLGFSVVEPFASKFPSRFLNVGVAEQNMAGIAAGLASEGFHVFTYSIANFPTFRCAEQIRNDIDYHNFPVTTVSVGGGLAYGNLGYSHHAVQDMSLMRSMPNTLLAVPADPLEVSASLDYLIKYPQPSYLRLNKTGEPVITKLSSISPGMPRLIRGSSKNKKIVIGTGSIVSIVVDAWELDSDKNNWSVYSLPLWGEKTRKSTYSFLKNFTSIISIEEHLLSGGFSSWLMESGVNVNPIAIVDYDCGKVGTQNYLREINNLDISTINLFKDEFF